MEQIPSNVKKSPKALLFAIASVIILVLVALSIWYFLPHREVQTNPQVPSTTAASEERARIIAELNAATKNTPPLTSEERARIIAELNAATKNTPPLTAEERANIISELSNQSK